MQETEVSVKGDLQVGRNQVFPQHSSRDEPRVFIGAMMDIGEGEVVVASPFVICSREFFILLFGKK
jgi:hypothetical protein